MISNHKHKEVKGKLPFKIRYGIIAVDKKIENNEISVLHFCGYEKKPTKVCFTDLAKELSTDREFGLVGKSERYFLMEAPKDVVTKFARMVVRGNSV